MDVKKEYTKVMHKAIQNAIRNNFRLDYAPGKLIRFIYNTKNGVTFKFNTAIPCVTGVDAKFFLTYTYESIIEDLQRIYIKTQTNNTFQLRS